MASLTSCWYVQQKGLFICTDHLLHTFLMLLALRQICWQANFSVLVINRCYINIFEPSMKHILENENYTAQHTRTILMGWRHTSESSTQSSTLADLVAESVGEHHLTLLGDWKSPVFVLTVHLIYIISNIHYTKNIQLWNNLCPGCISWSLTFGKKVF